jgi:hypothetical protein
MLQNVASSGGLSNPKSADARRAADGSAGLQPAVSRVCNPPTPRTFLNDSDYGMTCRLQVGGYSRLQACATALGISAFGLNGLLLSATPAA